MKRKKLIKNVSLVALSAVMMCGAAVAFAGCGSSEYTLTVSIFCNDSDAATNEAICNTWAAKYLEEHRSELNFPEGQGIEIEFNHMSDTEEYFSSLKREYSTGNAADIIYLSPKFVRAWVEMGRVLDISEFVDAEGAEQLSGIWDDSLGFYSYVPIENRGDGTYTNGERVTYDAQGKDGAGFYTASGLKAGIYGLPKDYSNFGMAFNGKFFTDQIKEALTTETATTTRTVKGAAGENTSALTYTGEGDSGVITYAVTSDYENPYKADYNEGTSNMTATAGQDAPIINVGVPTRYKPYNFYRFKSYQDAIDGRDIIASAVQTWSPDIDGDGNGDGYVVTIPGFPGETYEIEDSWRSAENETTKDANAIYDADIEHVVFTYQEFGALTWALTYYYNTFNWNCKNSDGYAAGSANNKSGQWTIAGTHEGTGGIKNEAGTYTNVYGNDQYEGSPGPTLYLLPWLYGNNADFINKDGTLATAEGVGNTLASVSSLDSIAKMQDFVKGAVPEKQSRVRTSGNSVDVDIYYGVNTDKFFEAFGAFLEYGSTWNGNCGNVGDYTGSKSDNGWAYFRGGANIFYGSGTWDSATRNESDLNDYCEFHQMPQAVSESYALYSTVKDGYYNQVEYANGTKTTLATGDQPYDGEEPNLPSTPYTLDAVRANLLLRQDKWGARMDSVGFAANAQLEELADTDQAWKIEAAVSLVMALCVDEDAQRTLTYSGAQIPNFKQQCTEFLHYQDAEYADGTFKDMITPDGDAAGENVWQKYYDVAWEMDQAAREIGAYAQYSNYTVEQFMNEVVTKEAGHEDIKWDTQYNADVMKNAPGENSKRGWAMKILRMTTFTYADRDLNLRMQYGTNSARDSAMYTYDTDWINKIYMRNGLSIAYVLSAPLPEGATITGRMKRFASQSPTVGTEYTTAAAFCLRTMEDVKKELDEAKQTELNDVNEYRQSLGQSEFTKAQFGLA